MPRELFEPEWKRSVENEATWLTHQERKGANPGTIGLFLHCVYDFASSIKFAEEPLSGRCSQTMLDELIRWLSVGIKFPMPIWVFVRRIENRLLKKRITHRRSALPPKPIRNICEGPLWPLCNLKTNRMERMFVV